MSRYLVTLKPVDKFFFGSDMTFEIPGNDNHNRMFKSYIIESSMFPQQTSLLGMMRFLLLRKSPYFKDGMISDKSKASKLIGGHSFQVNNHDDYGKILSLTGCFIHDRHNNLDYSFAPFTHKFKLQNTEKTGYVNGIKINIPDILEYEAKKGYDKYLLSREGEKKIDDIFVADRRIGINRNINTGQTEDSALFKQISYRFYDFDKDNGNRIADYCFAFYVDVDDIDLTSSEYNGEVVSVGADNSQFVINFEKDIVDNRPTVKHDNAIVLQSPAYLSRNTLSHCSFFVTQTIPFRFLETSVDKTDDYTIYSKTLKRSNKYELYAPGSIFFFSSEENMNKFISHMTNKDGDKETNEFAKVGFNEFSK